MSALSAVPAMPAVPPGRPSAHQRRRLGLAGLVVLAALSVPGRAGADDDHEQARAAVLSGQALPLDAVLARLKRSHPGQVLAIELEREHGRWIYEIKLLQPDGRLMKLEVDARTVEVLAARQRGERASESAR